jgi:hypothetical protein
MCVIIVLVLGSGILCRSADPKLNVRLHVAAFGSDVTPALGLQSAFVHRRPGNRVTLDHGRCLVDRPSHVLCHLIPQAPHFAH